MRASYRRIVFPGPVCLGSQLRPLSGKVGKPGLPRIIPCGWRQEQSPQIAKHLPRCWSSNAQFVPLPILTGAALCQMIAEYQRGLFGGGHG